MLFIIAYFIAYIINAGADTVHVEKVSRHEIENREDDPLVPTFAYGSSTGGRGKLLMTANAFRTAASLNAVVPVLF